MIVLYLLVFVVTVRCGPSTESSYKDQFCTDPRTMKKHAAYTEWADAYSCTRHRCQPGGRNLAIYTVGCKRVEAPESAIECEEVVEDTNMQFPYCCTRLRCLVLVRGEVWTRVLGQPWETLSAAPWSHMYKMKKPPPGDSSLLPKSPGEGPVYELTSDAENGKVLRASKKSAAVNPDCNEVQVPRAMPGPDFVIAVSTGTETEDHKKNENSRLRSHKVQPASSYYDNDELSDHHNEIELEESATEREKSELNPFAWTEVPPDQSSDADHDVPLEESETAVRDGSNIPDFGQSEEKKDEKPSNLQALVDAIGTRMRDIENVVQRMSEKVQQAKPGQPDYVSGEKGSLSDTEIQVPHKHRKGRSEEGKDHKELSPKRPSLDGDHYKRFSVRNRGSKYLHTSSDITTEQPLFIEDNKLNGYFSDASNSVLRRANPPKEPPSMYMAPVENRRKATHILVSEEAEKKRKKHTHKRKKSKGKNKKKHRKGKKKNKKKQNIVHSAELDINIISLEDSSSEVST